MYFGNGRESNCSSRSRGKQATIFHSLFKALSYSSCSIYHCLLIHSRALKTHKSIFFGAQIPNLSRVLTWKPGVCQNAALHALPATRKSVCFPHFYLLTSFSFIFPQILFSHTVAYVSYYNSGFDFYIWSDEKCFIFVFFASERCSGMWSKLSKS